MQTRKTIEGLKMYAQRAAEIATTAREHAPDEFEYWRLIGYAEAMQAVTERITAEAR